MEEDPKISGNTGDDGSDGDDNGGGGAAAEAGGGGESGEVLSLSIKLGDFITIIAPTHQEIHEHTFLVDYVSSRKIKLIDTDTLTPYILKIDATGIISNTFLTCSYNNYS